MVKHRLECTRAVHRADTDHRSRPGRSKPVEEVSLSSLQRLYKRTIKTELASRLCASCGMHARVRLLARRELSATLLHLADEALHIQRLARAIVPAGREHSSRASARSTAEPRRRQLAAETETAFTARFRTIAKRVAFLATVEADQFALIRRVARATATTAESSLLKQRDELPNLRRVDGGILLRQPTSLQHRRRLTRRHTARCVEEVGVDHLGQGDRIRVLTTHLVLLFHIEANHRAHLLELIRNRLNQQLLLSLRAPTHVRRDVAQLLADPHRQLLRLLGRAARLELARGDMHKCLLDFARRLRDSARLNPLHDHRTIAEHSHVGRDDLRERQCFRTCTVEALQQPTSICLLELRVLDQLRFRMFILLRLQLLEIKRTDDRLHHPRTEVRVDRGDDHRVPDGRAVLLPVELARASVLLGDLAKLCYHVCACILLSEGDARLALAATRHGRAPCRRRPVGRSEWCIGVRTHRRARAALCPHCAPAVRYDLTTTRLPRSPRTTRSMP